MSLEEQCTLGLEADLASAGQPTQGMFDAVEQIAADTRYCILQTLPTTYVPAG